ncbi:MAG: glycosyltransferase family 4 protein [Saccharofermentans sp.]|nr:glycosyltransferase family 4 protein [Saccharofermentans sp.]
MKALYITCSNIYDPKGNGGCKDSQAKLNMLRDYVGADVDVFVFLHKNEKNLPPNDNYLMQPKSNLGLLLANLFGGRKYYPWQLGKLKTMIRNNNYDVVFIGESVLGNLVKLVKKGKTFVFFQNVESDYSHHKVEREGKKFLPAYWCALNNERTAVRKADKIGALNSRDAGRISELYGRQPDVLLPITFEDNFDAGKIVVNNDRTLMFLGSYFGPNRDSVIWFMENVLPKLDRFKLKIVGLGFENEKATFEAKYSGVEVIGGVYDLSDISYSYPGFVMPILYGAGMKVKTAEAMMYGRTILGSDEALEGYEVDGVNGIYRCNTADEYVETIKALYSSEIPSVNDEVRKVFLDKYERGTIKNRFANMMKELGV